jgi:hypothetical protein
MELKSVHHPQTACPAPSQGERDVLFCLVRPRKDIAIVYGLGYIVKVGVHVHCLFRVVYLFQVAVQAACWEWKCPGRPIEDTWKAPW